VDVGLDVNELTRAGQSARSGSRLSAGARTCLRVIAGAGLLFSARVKNADVGGSSRSPATKAAILHSTLRFCTISYARW